MASLGDWDAVHAAVARASAKDFLRTVRWLCRDSKPKLKRYMRTIGRAMTRASVVAAPLATAVFEPRDGDIDMVRAAEVLQQAADARNSPRIKNAGRWRGAPHAAPCGLMDVAHPPTDQVVVPTGVLVNVAADYAANGDTRGALATHAALKRSAEDAHAHVASAADGVGMVLPTPDPRAESRARATLDAFDESRRAWHDRYRPGQFHSYTRRIQSVGGCAVYAPVVHDGVRVRIARAGDTEDASALATPASVEDVLVVSGSCAEVVVGPHDPSGALPPVCGIRANTTATAFRPTHTMPSHVSLTVAAAFVDKYAATLDVSPRHALRLGPGNMRTEHRGGGVVEFCTHPVVDDPEFDAFVHARSVDDPHVRLAAALLVLTVPDMTYTPFLDVATSSWPSPSSLPSPATDAGMALAPPVVALAVRVLLDADTHASVPMSQLSDALRAPVTPRAWRMQYDVWTAREGVSAPVADDADAQCVLRDAIAKHAATAGTMTPYGYVVTAANAIDPGRELYRALLGTQTAPMPAYHPYTYLTPRALLASAPCGWLGDGSRSSPLGAAIAALSPSHTTLPAFSDAIAVLSASAAAAMGVPPGLSPDAASENANAFVVWAMKLRT